MQSRCVLGHAMYLYWLASSVPRCSFMIEISSDMSKIENARQNHIANNITDFCRNQTVFAIPLKARASLNFSRPVKPQCPVVPLLRLYSKINYNYALLYSRGFQMPERERSCKFIHITQSPQGRQQKPQRHLHFMLEPTFMLHDFKNSHTEWKLALTQQRQIVNMSKLQIWYGINLAQCLAPADRRKRRKEKKSSGCQKAVVTKGCLSQFIRV